MKFLTVFLQNLFEQEENYVGHWSVLDLDRIFADYSSQFLLNETQNMRQAYGLISLFLMPQAFLPGEHFTGESHVNRFNRLWLR